jgi:hypothetical protein
MVVPDPGLGMVAVANGVGSTDRSFNDVRPSTTVELNDPRTGDFTSISYAPSPAGVSATVEYLYSTPGVYPGSQTSMRVLFLVTTDMDYTISGYFRAASDNGSYTSGFSAQFDEIRAPGSSGIQTVAALYRSDQTGSGSPLQSLDLETVAGAPSGRLLAGHWYYWYFVTRISDTDLADNSPVRAMGAAELRLTPVVPTPSAWFGGLLLMSGLWIWRFCTMTQNAGRVA